MLILVGDTDKLRVETLQARDIDVHASWIDSSSSGITPGRTNTEITTATVADVVAAPAAGAYRNVKTLTVYNKEAADACDIRVMHTDNAAEVILWAGNLAASQSLVYSDEIGFVIADPSQSDVIAAAVAAGIAASAVRFDAAQSLTEAQRRQARENIDVMVQGQCYLSLSGANLQLARKNGKFLFINGKLEEVPDTPITLAPSGITTTGGIGGTALYAIYAYMNAGVMTLEYSSTNHALDSGSGDGHQIKNGDATRSLVGLWAASASNTWHTTATCGVSLYQPRWKLAATAGNPAVSSTTPVEMASNMRVPFTTFTDRAVIFSMQCQRVDQTVAAQDVVYNLGLNGIASRVFNSDFAPRLDDTAANLRNTHAATRIFADQIAQGFHYVTPYGYVSGGVANWTALITDVNVFG